jgi:hypothetical protein
LVPQQAELRMTPVLGGLLILPPLTYMLTLLLRRKVQQRQQQPGRQRRKRAARTALAALQQLTRLQGASEADICEAVHRILTRYLCDKLDLQHAGLTVADVTHHLQTRSVEPMLIEQSEALFHLCDSARYAPGSLAVSQLTHLIEDAETCVQRLEASQQL